MGFLDDLSLLGRHAPEDARNLLKTILSGVPSSPDEGRNLLKTILGDMPGTRILRGEGGQVMDEASRYAAAENAKASQEIANYRAGKPSTMFNPNHTDPAAMDIAMNFGMNPMGLLGKIVYHGSPHKFDKFDASKIGTGEGAQAYGHGIYMADSPKVAAQYQLTQNAPGYLDAKRYQLADEAWEATGGDKLKAIAYLTEKAKSAGSNTARQQIYDAANNIETLIKNRPGGFYKADLPDEWIPKMLDWDKPLSQQPEVLKVLESHPTMGKGSMGWRGAPEGLWERAMASPTRTGEWLYREIANNAPKETAGALQQAGIPGIRYLDGGSRGKGQGSYNYVVFPGLEDKVKILERNGMPLK